jgi:hypothetical protein
VAGDEVRHERLRRRTLWLGWSAVTFGVLVLGVIALAALVIYLRYEAGLGG